MMRVTELSVITMTMREENVTNHNLPVGWDTKKAGGRHTLVLWAYPDVREMEKKQVGDRLIPSQVSRFSG